MFQLSQRTETGAQSERSIKTHLRSAGSPFNQTFVKAVLQPQMTKYPSLWAKSSQSHNILRNLGIWRNQTLKHLALAGGKRGSLDRHGFGAGFGSQNALLSAPLPVENRSSRRPDAGIRERVMNQNLSPLPCGKQGGKPVHFLSVPVHPVDIQCPNSIPVPTYIRERRPTHSAVRL
jgi:hypothetical protein